MKEKTLRDLRSEIPKKIIDWWFSDGKMASRDAILIKVLELVEKQDKQFIKKVLGKKRKFKEFMNLSYIQGWEDCFEDMCKRIKQKAGGKLI
ncbi:MAG: hypothetical protein IIA87_03245 [Nanoarchaeota archaeon]|nr:hypothetical protein [Nanoarchaeota archaeon]